MKQGIIEYFKSTNQHVSIAFLHNGFQIHKNFLYQERGEAFDRILFENRKLLNDVWRDIDTYKPFSHLIALPEDMRQSLYDNFPDSPKKLKHFIEATRVQIAEEFDFPERSIVLFLRNRIFIRYFTPPKERSGAERRYAGESVELMEAMYQHHFPEGAWEEIRPYLDDVLAEELNFAEIHNNYFRAHFTRVFCMMVDILLVEHLMGEEKEKAEAFCGYVLRQNFHAIMHYVAENLLLHVQQRDSNAEQFIKYFADEVIVDGAGKKVQKYAIVDRNNNVWNYSAVLSVMIQHKQLLKRIDMQKETINAEAIEVQKSKKASDAQARKRRPAQERIDTLEERRVQQESELGMLKYTLKMNKETESSTNALQRLKTEIEKVQSDKKEAQNDFEIIKNRHANLEKELTLRQKRLRNEQRTLELIIEQGEGVMEKYDLLTHALADTLMKR